MIREEYKVVETLIGYTVRCDECRSPRLTFVTKRQAKEWLEDRDEDYEEYGQFSEGEVFQRVLGKLYCERCTERLIDQTKTRKDCHVATKQTT